MSKAVGLMLALLMLVGTAMAGAVASGTLAAGQLTEFSTYLGQLSERVYGWSGGKANGNPEILLDTLSIPQGRIYDTLTLTKPGFFPFVWSNDEAESFGIKVYSSMSVRNSTPGSITLTLPDSACFYAPVTFNRIIIERPAADTASANIMNVVYVPAPPIN